MLLKRTIVEIIRIFGVFCLSSLDEQIIRWFNHFHENAEVSWKEYKTTEKIAQILQENGVNYRMFDGIPGLVAEIGEGEDVIAMRADIDALWQEVDGVMKANHSCGHDANITMVLGVIMNLKDQALGKRIRFIFQPAEETGGGALETIKQNVLDGVSMLFGVHLRPIEELPLGKVSPAIHHGAVVFLKGKIHGVDAHGARPHQGKNAIDCLVSIYQFIQSIHMDPFEVCSVKMTRMQADGGSINIIPGNAEFSIDIRAQKNEVLTELIEKIEQGIQMISLMQNTPIELEWYDRTPGAVVSEEASQIARKSIVESLGESALAPEVHTPGSDDFHYYTVMKPELKAAMIGVGADLEPGLHHPKMHFNQQALFDGIKVLSATLKNAASVFVK